MGEFALVGKPVGVGEVLLGESMADIVRDYVAQEFLPRIGNRKVAELDSGHDLTKAAAGFSEFGKDGRIHRHVASVALHHGMDTWTLGMMTTDTLTGEIQHRKIRQYRIVSSAGKVMEAYVQKRFIIDRADYDIESTLKHNNSVLIRKALEKPLTDETSWELIELLESVEYEGRPDTYLGIPIHLYP